MKKIFMSLLGLLFIQTAGLAQPPRGISPQMMEQETWEVSINQMDNRSREQVNQIVAGLQLSASPTRSVFKDIFGSMLTGGLTAAVDVVATEIINLAKYKKNQKEKWMQMIERECNYTDSLSSIKGLTDFYSETSNIGAFDPSNINFDGISLRGMRDGREVLYMSCHIDMSRLQHMFRHSKFNLVLDTLVFHPYDCHLPNLQANGIRMMRGEKTERDNSFSFDERKNLCVSLEMTLTSSWVNEAVMVMDNVELGKFKLNVNIDQNKPVFIYSRKQIEQNRALGLQSDTTFIQIDGDCFVVPRSFMPSFGGQRTWGTGEYNVKVKMRETCQFNTDEERNKKMKQWYKDYKQLRKMQKKGSLLGEYFRNVCKQNGNTIVKEMLKKGITTTMQETGVLQTATTAMPSGAMPASMGAGSPGTAAAPQATPQTTPQAIPQATEMR